MEQNTLADVSTPSNRAQPPPKQSRKLLPIIGALILFITFVVKDNKRESVRELRDRIAAARTDYELHEAIAETALRAGSLNSAVDRNFAVATIQSSGVTPASAAWMMLMRNDTARANVEFSKDTVSNVKRLLEAAHIAEKHPGEIDDFTRRFVSLEGRTDDITNYCLRLLRAKEVSTEAVKKANESVVGIGGEAQDIAARAKRYATDSFTDMTRRLEDAESSYETVSDWSNFLYGAGWFVGLIGLLKG